jgi:hypothetical protein
MTMPDSKGVSILSKAFNSERRSWHLKIDIEARTNNRERRNFDGRVEFSFEQGNSN